MKKLILVILCLTSIQLCSMKKEETIPEVAEQPEFIVTLKTSILKQLNNKNNNIASDQIDIVANNINNLITMTAKSYTILKRLNSNTATILNEYIQQGISELPPALSCYLGFLGSIFCQL